MVEKGSFLLFDDMYEPIRNMSLEEKGELLDCIFQYRLGETEINPKNPSVFMAFQFIRQTIDRADMAYLDRCQKNAINGKKGGRPHKQKENETTDKQSNKPKKPNGYSENPKNQMQKTESEKSLPDPDPDPDPEKDIKKTPLPPLGKFDAEHIDLPDKIDRGVWSRWIQYLRGKRIIIAEETAGAQISFLLKWATKGVAPEEIISRSIEKGWKSLIDPPHVNQQERQSQYKPTVYQALTPEMLAKREQQEREEWEKKREQNRRLKA